MTKLKFSLQSGTIVQLEGLEISNTYGEYLAGSPSFEDNFKVYEELKTPLAWGDRKTLYDKSSFYLDNVFKPYIICVWLSGQSVNDVENKYDGSEAVVFFTVSNISKLSIEQLLIEGLSNFNYNKYAENYKI
jgi:hypothetical protein